MDDYDMYLYSIDAEPFEENESDNDVLDNIDEGQVYTDSAVTLVPASSPTRETEGNDDKQLEPSLTVSKAMSRCNRVLAEKFGFSKYKGKQKEIIEAAILGADVFVLAPTGMGKSLCFQIPAVAEDSGVSIVISPLLALMKNQVTNLRSKGISAVSLTSETTKREKSELMNDLSSKRPKNRLFYTTPEKFCTQDLMRVLATVYSNGQLSRLVIDEAHCISEWGHDFREEYRKLGFFRERFPGVPIMALTATATKNVQRDIVRSLKMVENRLFTALHPFNRANLFYEVRYKSAPESPSLMQDILEFIDGLHRRRNRPSSGIIYCRKRETCDELSNYLRGKGIRARPYHRGISSKTLNKTLNEWEAGGTGEGGVDVVCATIAFGMGIDKSDVRYIIHYDLPKSMEGNRLVIVESCLLVNALRQGGQVEMDCPPAVYYTTHAKTLSVSGNWCPVPTLGDKAQPLLRMDLSPVNGQSTVSEHSSVLQRTSRPVDMLYFGEIIDTTNDDAMENICDKMCDVCKYPDRTRQRKTNLSEEDYAVAVISRSAWNTGYSDDEDTEGRKQPREQQQRAPASGGVTTTAPDPGQMTLWDCLNSAPAQGFKRPNAHGRDKLALPGSKRAKVAHPKAGADSTGSTSSASTRASMPPPLITRPHSSVNSLRKPFKTPFKVPADSEPRHCLARVHHYPPIEDEKRAVVSPPTQDRCVIEEDVEIVEVRIKQDPNVPVPDNAAADPADVDVNVEAAMPEIEMQLEAPFSRKVDLDVRTHTWHAFRRSLHQVFPLASDETDVPTTAWHVLPGAPTSVEGRVHVVADAAKILEYAIHMMCATLSGYEGRVERYRRAMPVLGANEGEGRGTRTAISLSGGAKGKNEEAEEIMDALRDGVKRWNKTHRGGM